MKLCWSLAMIAGILGIAASSAEASPNLVTNGGFESNGGVGELAGGISFATGWTVGATTDGAPSPFVFILDTTADSVGFASVFSPPTIKIWGPANGINNGFTGSASDGYFLGDDGGYATAPVSQAIGGLTPGSQYTLTFEWAAAQFTDVTGSTNQSWTVTFGSDVVSTPTAANPSQGFTGWNTYTHTFTATSASEALSFLAVGPTGLPPFALLDGVSLVLADDPGSPTAAPEPSTVVMLGLGLVGAGLARRFRRRRPAAWSTGA